MLEINEKKIIIMKKRKKIVQKIELGYCQDCIVRKKIVLQGLHCIAIEKTGLENFVLQYTSLYCRLGGVVLQDCIARGLQENCIAI